MNRGLCMMKREKKRIFFIGICIVILLIIIVLLVSNQPLTKEKTVQEIERVLEKEVSENDEISSVLMAIHSDKQNFHQSFAVGKTGRELDDPVNIDMRFHAASIGKTFTATVCGMLRDEKVIHFNDKIIDYLKEDVLDGLFTVEGIDYKNEVTIMQLLNHTSGIGDYFEDPVAEGNTMQELMLLEPDKLWTPMELIDFTRHGQKAVNRPGEAFHYSDTGYILLGLIVEAVEGKEFHEILHERLFGPLEMDNSYLMFKSNASVQPDKPILEIRIQGHDLSTANSLSIDWAGGGIVTTADDLWTFFRALNAGELIAQDTIETMKTFDQKYADGIYYGLGMMSFDFGELSPMLKGMPSVYGGVGATGCFMLYNSLDDTYYIANFGSLGYTEKGIMNLIEIMNIYSRMQE